VKTIEEELLSYEVPQSEDEFELPSPRHMKERPGFQEKTESTEKAETASDWIKQSVSKAKVSTSSYVDKAMALKRIFESNQKYKKKHKPREKKVILNNSTSLINVRAIKQKNEALANPPRPHSFFAHLSPNRFLNNFHSKDPRFIVHGILSTGVTDDGLVLLDAKSIDVIRKKLEKFKQNLVATEELIKEYDIDL